MKIKIVNFEFMGRIKEWTSEPKAIENLENGGLKITIENPTPFEPKGQFIELYFDDKNQFDRKNTDVAFINKMYVEITQ